MDVPERFIDVAVNSGQPSRRAFTYRIPPGMDAAPGSAVFVTFGTRVLHGVALDEVPPPAGVEVRDLDALADPEPVLDDAHVALARWLSDAYLAPLWDCVAVCLPSGSGQRHVTMVAPVAVPPLLPIYPQDSKILSFIGSHGRVTLDQLKEGVGPVSVSRLERLQRDGYLTVAQGLAPPAGHHRVERRLQLIGGAGPARERAAQLAVRRPRSVEARLLELLADHAEVSLGAARDLGASRSHLDRLIEAGLVRETARTIDRDPLAGRGFEHRPLPTLTTPQQAVADAIAGQPGEYLLHGVTGSGKTEVYLDLVGRTLAAGGSAIILVPEISLTPQAIRRYGERFGDTLALFHSGLGTGELYDQWFRVRRGAARVVVGSRSALFAPVQRLGLVVIDEEHEWTYKQEAPQPRYHARDAARALCGFTGATLVLGSATPDVTTYHRTETGAATRLELPDRIDPGPGESMKVGTLPVATVVDMRDELRRGNRGMFSYALLRAAVRALRLNEQVLLFVNRRGGARFLLCRDCGYVATCPTCHATMSMDTSNPIDPRVVCHHCGRRRALEEYCPTCNGRRYRPFGVGTQRVEQEARAMFPGARVLRWDSDTAAAKGAHERIVGALEAGEVDVLVGTQVLAKGLDLPAMTVVGVVDADIGLHLPDYTAHERAFQLLSQVSGRAGRRERRGEVYIQTYDPENVAIRCAAGNDYRAFYEHEIAHRRRAGYPPFARLVRLVFRHRNEEAGLEEASRVASELRLRRDVAGRADPEVLGPTPAYIARLRGNVRWQVLLRGHDPAALVARIRLGPGWTVDVDPVGLLT